MKEIFAFENFKRNPFYLGVIDIEPQDLLNFKNEVLTIDVRDPNEYIGELSHIVDSVNIPLKELTQKLFDLPKDKAIVFICKSGNRSAQACKFAQQMGYNHVYGLHGGMTLWNQLNLPTHAQGAE